MFSIFAPEHINKGRQAELDFAKGLAVLFMILIHVQEYFSHPLAQGSMVGSIIEYLGDAPAAPVFMFLLGVGMVYSSKSDPKQIIKRGLLILLAGYLLSFIRGTIPNLIQWYLYGDRSYLLEAFNNFIYVDIFQFAGLVTIIFGLVKKYRLGFFWIGTILIFASTINIFLLRFGAEGYLYRAITGLFWGSSDISFFPLLTWIFYPLAGYFFGSWLIRCADKNRFYGTSFVVSIILLALFTYVLGEGLNMSFGVSTELGYYHHTFFGNLVFCSIAVAWISFLYFATKALPTRIKSHVERWSRHVSEIYFTQWVLIGWLTLAIGVNTLQLPYYFILTAAVFVMSDYLAYWYLSKKSSLVGIIRSRFFHIPVIVVIIFVCGMGVYGVIEKQGLYHDVISLFSAITPNSLERKTYQTDDFSAGESVFVFSKELKRWESAIYQGGTGEDCIVEFHGDVDDTVECSQVRKDVLREGDVVKVEEEDRGTLIGKVITRQFDHIIVDIDGKKESVELKDIFLDDVK